MVFFGFCFFQLLWHENCQLSLNHGVITGSENTAKRRNPACFSDAKLIAEARFGYCWGGQRKEEMGKIKTIFSLIKKTR